MYEIVTDTSANLTAADLVPGLSVISFSYTQNGEGHTVSPVMSDADKKSFFAALREKAKVHTSQINTTAFKEVFEAKLLEGKDVLYVGMSAGISGTFRQAELAAEELSEAYPDRRILTVNTKNASFGEGLLVFRALRNREQGMGIAENAADLEAMVPHTRGVFVVDDLAHLFRTGRVSGIVAFAGTMLGIKPLLYGDDTGHIVVRGKVRGKRAALSKLAEELFAHILPQKQSVVIAHCDAEEDAAYLAEQVGKNPYSETVRTEWYEPVTGSHLGPGAVALFYLADVR